MYAPPARSATTMGSHTGGRRNTWVSAIREKRIEVEIASATTLYDTTNRKVTSNLGSLLKIERNVPTRIFGFAKNFLQRVDGAVLDRYGHIFCIGADTHARDLAIVSVRNTVQFRSDMQMKIIGIGTTLKSQSSDILCGGLKGFVHEKKKGKAGTLYA
jgi:hypothetical protein